MDTIFKTFLPEVELKDEGARRVQFRISTDAVDRDRDTIAPGGWKLGNYLKNPVVLFAHDYRSLPVARAVEMKQTEHGLSAIAEFPAKGTYEFADTVYDMVRGGFLGATSVGFRPTIKPDFNNERNGYDYKEQELLEFSIVPVPSNPDALVELRSNSNMKEECRRWTKGLLQWAVGASADPMASSATIRKWEGFCADLLIEAGTTQSTNLLSDDRIKQLLKFNGLADDVAISEKAVPPDVSRTMAPEGQAWSAPSLADFTDKNWGDLSDTEKRSIAGHYAYAANMPPEKFGDLKLPHHDAGNGKVVWRGVAAAMAAMMGSRGGVSIPTNEHRAVVAHLTSHYKQFGKEPPKTLKEAEDQLEAIDLEGTELCDVEKPYPNEHACRLQDPGKFDRFRRGSRTHAGKTYDIIFGHPKTGGGWQEQAYRYPKDTWTAAAAKAHCSSHDGVSFEAASGKEAECQDCHDVSEDVFLIDEGQDEEAFEIDDGEEIQINLDNEAIRAAVIEALQAALNEDAIRAEVQRAVNLARGRID